MCDVRPFLDNEARARRNKKVNDGYYAAVALVDGLVDRLPDSVVESARSALHGGEFIFVVINVSAALIKRSISITADQRVLLVRALTAIGERSDEAYLTDHEATLARITVEG